jgi:hypothetical protein
VNGIQLILKSAVTGMIDKYSQLSLLKLYFKESDLNVKNPIKQFI